MKMISLEKISR